MEKPVITRTEDKFPNDKMYFVGSLDFEFHCIESCLTLLLEFKHRIFFWTAGLAERLMFDIQSREEFTSIDPKG